MKIVVRRFKPMNDKEKMFCVEAEVNEVTNPGTAFIVLDGKEYLIEVHHEFSNMASKI